MSPVPFDDSDHNVTGGMWGLKDLLWQPETALRRLSPRTTALLNKMPEQAALQTLRRAFSDLHPGSTKQVPPELPSGPAPKIGYRSRYRSRSACRSVGGLVYRSALLSLLHRVACAHVVHALKVLKGLASSIRSTVNPRSVTAGVLRPLPSRALYLPPCCAVLPKST